MERAQKDKGKSKNKRRRHRHHHHYHPYSRNDDEFVEGIVCRETDLAENEMKDFKLDGGKILLIKQNGVFSAIGAVCTHSPGGKLAKGILGNGHVRCPDHLACFNILTGDIEDFPGVDSLPCHQVILENGNVKVRAKRSELKSDKRTKCMAKLNPEVVEKFVVIGGGPAGGICVETLRQEGFTGAITLICKENTLPYNRVMVSKKLDVDLQKISFRNDEFYETNGIQVLKGIEATNVDNNAKTVNLSNGNTIKFDKLFIATGLRALKANVPGADLKNIITLQNVDDNVQWAQQLGRDKEVVVIGGGFVAMESAIASLGEAKKVTVVMKDDAPFKTVFGERIGKAFVSAFEEKGVRFIQSEIKRYIDDGNGNVAAVELGDGQTLNADLVIMGIGSSFSTDFLRQSSIELRDDGSIEVDEYLKTNVDGVFAGGDIAFAPISLNSGLKAVYPHYPLAHYHGRIAALNMLNKKEPIKYIPHFWTKMSFTGLQHCGYREYDDIIYEGDVEGLNFVAFYLKNDEVVAVASRKKPVTAQFIEYLLQGKKLTRKDLEGDKMAWAKNILS